MYSPTNKNTWLGRVDQNEGDLGLRWHQKMKLIDLNTETLPDLNSHEKGIVIIGFKCDEGVRRNKGRIGAKEGPEWVRLACCNHADHFHESTIFFDGGDVICTDHDLEGAQNELQNLITTIKTKGYFPFVFGGGHEVAFPHFMGLFDATPKERHIGIINIDAHFDLRIPEDKPSSGTPFFQISKICQENHRPFNYFCIGIQHSANTQALFERANSLDVEYILANEINETMIHNHINHIKNFIEKVDYIYLTICLDVFDISFAPGVSAPSAIGLHPNITLDLIKEIVGSGKLISADIAELNPSLDQDNKTSKLASKLTYEIITEFQAMD